MVSPVSFRWPTSLVARVDLARGDVPRTVWVRRAVEQALSEAEGLLPARQADPGPVDSLESVRSAASAEQSEMRGLRNIMEETHRAAARRIAEQLGVEQALDVMGADDVPEPRVSSPRPAPAEPRFVGRQFRRDVKPFQRPS